MQLVGKRFDDRVLLVLAKAYQGLVDWDGLISVN
jgi:Asp-tRNA(Asn)/Glu-tRNA(Gln) amidotransferase A subunit family amidase